MKLIIFPGAGDPHFEKYAKVYGLLRGKAGPFGYSEVDTSIRWPGQFLSNPNKTDSLNFQSAVALAKSVLNTYEASGEYYDILARSFGTAVALSATIDGTHSKLRRIILWGATPHWKTWEFFVRDLKSIKQVAHDKGVRIDQELYSSCEPIEALLQKTPQKVVVAVGSLDVYSGLDFHHYLSVLLTGKSNILFRTPVEGAPHEVTGELPDLVVQDYCKAVLG